MLCLFHVAVLGIVQQVCTAADDHVRGILGLQLLFDDAERLAQQLSVDLRISEHLGEALADGLQRLVGQLLREHSGDGVQMIGVQPLRNVNDRVLDNARVRDDDHQRGLVRHRHQLHMLDAQRSQLRRDDH